jgi:hypothetical protein
MAAEAEAAREARAKVIAAEGEQKAARYESKDASDNHCFLPSIICRALKDAADVIMQSPVALQLRYLQTLTTIASEKNSTIVFPIPVSNPDTPIDFPHPYPVHRSNSCKPSSVDSTPRADDRVSRPCELLLLTTYIHALSRLPSTSVRCLLKTIL